jgi:hypothetical protein
LGTTIDSLKTTLRSKWLKARARSTITSKPTEITMKQAIATVSPPTPKPTKPKDQQDRKTTTTK